MSFSLYSLFLAFISRYNHANDQTNKSSRTRGKSLQIVPAAPTMLTETWAISSTIASFMFAWAIISRYSPYKVRHLIDKLRQRLKDYLNPCIKITIREFTEERPRRSEAYALVEAYLSSISSKNANRLRVDMENEDGNLVFSMDDYQQVTDEYEGVEVWWGLRRVLVPTKHMYAKPGKRSYKLTFPKECRELVTKSYLDHVMKRGKEVRMSNKQRKLYTNVGGSSKSSSGMWSHIVFEHPASFETMALDPEKKEEIVEDLLAFSRNKEFYERAGRAWRRGYLLYGPPGTGKSTMVAAMANLLSYDVYDLELTAVRNNTELRRLLIETTSKSIVVIEDIDCSLDLSGQRKKNDEFNNKDWKEVKEEGGNGANSSSKVTLSGLLNFIDGLWSACGEERLIVFTTNYVEKLDPALIRRGRMDKHIELSYCSFGGFKVLAKNYLGIESHQMFDKIESLMGEVKITPADVAENLVPKSPVDDPKKSLSSLIQAMEEAKEEAKETESSKEEASVLSSAG